MFLIVWFRVYLLFQCVIVCLLLGVQSKRSVILRVTHATPHAKSIGPSQLVAIRTVPIPVSRSSGSPRILPVYAPYQRTEALNQGQSGPVMLGPMIRQQYLAHPRPLSTSSYQQSDQVVASSDTNADYNAENSFRNVEPSSHQSEHQNETPVPMNPIPVAPVGVNVFVHASNQEQDNGNYNERQNYLINGVDVTNNGNDADQSDSKTVKLESVNSKDGEDHEDRANESGRTSHQSELQSQFDKINHELEKLNEDKRGMNGDTKNEQGEQCYPHCQHDKQQQSENEDGLKQQVLHLVLHKDENTEQDVPAEEDNYGQFMPATNGLNYPQFGSGSFAAPQPSIFAPYSKCAQDDDEDMHTYRIKSPLYLFSRFMKKLIS